MDDHIAKEAILFDTYKDRLGSYNPQPMKFNLSQMLRQEVDFYSLITPFTHAEIDAVVKEIPPDRAPGPDGFNGALIKACWPISKHDIY